ncbi:MAG: ABC transporter ATP-binding protein [Elainellaceae cyanobacterium]
MATLTIDHLHKSFGPKNVPVKDLSLAVAEGEFLTLLGPSGCGKSTILRLIAGLEQPTKGEIRIGDKRVNGVAPGDRNIAMVFQSYALYPHMTVEENIASGLKLRNIPAGTIQDRVLDVSKLLGIDHLLDRKPSKLSGGQRQRVALGRALVREPDVFLLDEPLSNLDALLREQVRAEMKQLFASRQTPVVYVTHDQTEAMTLSSRVAVLYNGDLQQLDPPDRIYTYPANRFVASFIGSPQMNLLTLSCQGKTAQLGQIAIPLPDNVAISREVVLGIRPEQIGIAQPDSALTVDGTVFLVENLGMGNLISVRPDGVDDDGVTLRALLPAEASWEGDRVTLALPAGSLHWFHPETGERFPDGKE